MVLAAGAAHGDARLEQGRALYNLNCYQCHGYNGDAATLASSYLEPRPRDFTRTTPRELPRARIVQVLRDGRPGTAMVSFARLLDAAQREAVADYIRARFQRAAARSERYHVAANGWPRHERYAAAFPFATGALALDANWESLTDEQRAGKRMFLSACVSCHDRARTDNPGPVWEARAVSYPRAGTAFTPVVTVDGVSGATPFHRHDVAPADGALAPAETRGRELFLQNCAFCHGADGSGRNWIGSFLEPRPRDVNATAIRTLPAAELRRRIEHGIAGTSMPAWRHVLDSGQIGDLVAYLRRPHETAAR